MDFSRTAHYPTPSFPPAQPSLSADGHGMREDYAAQGAQDGLSRAAMHSLQDIKPYLGLRSRLSQVWINRWTVLILLVLVRVLMTIGSLHDDIDDAKVQALSACSTVESMGSSVASLPYYMSTGVNELAASGIEKTVNGLYSGLFDVITAVEEIFVFWVNMYIGLYECLITFAVTGSLHVVLSAIQDVTSFLNTTITKVNGDIDSALSDFATAMNKFESTINNVESALTGSASAPAKIDLTSEMDALKNMQIPMSVSDEITKLNNSIPTFDEVKNATNNLLRLPFEEVKKLMNQSLGTYTVDRSIFPVPEREQLTFCNDNDGIDDFFQGLYDLAATARTIFIVVLVLAAIAACIPMGLLEIRRWRNIQDYAKRMELHSVDNIDKVYIASRPFTSNIGIKISSRFSNPRLATLMRWLVAYCTSVPALVLLSIALAGLFSALCQYTMLKAVEKEVPALAADIGQFADKVVDALNNASDKWANGTNTVINTTNAKLNEDVFGWVNTSTFAINNTLNTFVDDMITALNKTFGGTPLYDPILDVYTCLIGLKVAAVEQGLTWVSDHAHVDFPMFPNDTFSAGASKALASDNSTNGTSNSFLADPGSDATDKISAVVEKLVNKIASGIRTEAILAAAILGFYVVGVFGLGLARVILCMMKGNRSRAVGGPSYAGDVDQGARGMTEASPRSLHRSVISGPLEARRSSHVEMRSVNTGSLGSQNTDRSPEIPAVAHTFQGQPHALDHAPPAYEKRAPAFNANGDLPNADDFDEAEYQNEKAGYVSAQSTGRTNFNNSFTVQDNLNSQHRF